MEKGFEPSGYRSYELIKVLPSDVRSVLEYYEYMLPAVYDISIERRQSEEVITGIYKVLKHLHDPSGIKYYFYRMLELFMGKPGGITSSMMPKRISDKLDYLNLGHKAWSHPCYRDEISQESFWEIYGRAVKEGVGFIELFSSFIDSGRSPSRLLDMIDDISYSSGIKCGSPDGLIYFDSIFEDQS